MKSKSAIVSEADSTEIFRISCAQSENTELEAVRVEEVDDEEFTITPPAIQVGKHVKNQSVIVQPAAKNSFLESKDTKSDYSMSFNKKGPASVNDDSSVIKRNKKKKNKKGTVST